MDFTQGINLFVQAVSDKAIALLLAIAGIGTLSMAVLQTIKELTPARRIFNERFIRQWFTARHADLAETAEKQLILLATAGERHAFYELPIEQLCGQANAATQMVLEYPRKYEPLLRVLAAHADPEDVHVLLREPPPRPPGESSPRLQEEVDARTRITSLVQRSLDALQIAASHSWKFRLQTFAFLLSYTFTIVGVFAFAPGNGRTSVRDFVATIIVGLAAGFLAPIARDLVATLQRIRS